MVDFAQLAHTADELLLEQLRMEWETLSQEVAQGRTTPTAEHEKMKKQMRILRDQIDRLETRIRHRQAREGTQPGEHPPPMTQVIER